MTIKDAVIRGLAYSGRGTWEENKDFIIPALINDPNNDWSVDYAEWIAKSLEWYGTREDIEDYLSAYIEDEALHPYGWTTPAQAIEDMLAPYSCGQYPWEVWSSEDGKVWFLASTI